MSRVVGMEWVLELFLVVMLGATLFHAVRLERALGVLKRDRAELEDLVAGFNDSTRQAEQGVERLRSATEGAGKQIARQIDAALSLKDDLSFLVERSERAADKLDKLVRSARPLAAETPRPALHESARSAYVARADIAPVGDPEPQVPDPRIRSQAERDLLKALRMVR